MGAVRRASAGVCLRGRRGGVPASVGAGPFEFDLYSSCVGRQRGRSVLYRTAHDESPARIGRGSATSSASSIATTPALSAKRPWTSAPLDEVLSEFSVPAVDFIKLDVEGAELDILSSGTRCLASPSLLGMVSEIRLHPEINGSPPYAELDVFLRRHGLSLFDLEIHRHSRHALPYPGLQHYRRANGEPFFAYTTRGQVQDGNALYLRDLLLSGGELRRDSPFLRHAWLSRSSRCVRSWKSSR